MTNVTPTPNSINDRYAPVSGENTESPRFAPGWPAPAPYWAAYARVSGPARRLGNQIDVDFASEAPAPWHAHVEQFDFREGDGEIETEGPTIRVFGPPEDDSALEDITTPKQARQMAASLLRAANLLERIQTSRAAVHELDESAPLADDKQFTACPGWCTSQESHSIDVVRDGVEECSHASTPVQTGTGHAAWIERIDVRSSDGTITLGEIQLGVDLGRGPSLVPETAGAVAAMLFTVGMRVKRLRAGEPADE